MRKFKIYIGKAKQPIGEIDTEKPESWVREAFARVFTGGQTQFVRVEEVQQRYAKRAEVIRFGWN